jgi:hypothetical protein
MNGMLLLRRSLSVVLASSALAFAGCGVELGGLFDGDAGPVDAAQRDAGQDADSTADRAPDGRDDGAADGSFSDRSSSDGSSINDATGRDAAIDADADADAIIDVSVDRDATVDVSVDRDGAADIVSEPSQDATAQDTTVDPRLDVPIETSIDVVADAPADTSADRGDAQPPGTCTGGCNTFDNISQTITRTVDPGPTPTMTGGNILDGMYVVTGIVQYNGDNQMYSLSETSIISGNWDAWVSSTNGAAEVRYTTNFTVTNNQLAFTFCCPGAGNLTILYTTNGSTLSHVDSANPNRVITYTRQ